MNGICWIASYPKAGNHWLRCMVISYLTGEPVAKWSDIHAGIPHLEGLLRFGDVPPTDPDRQLLLYTHFSADRPVLRFYRDATVKVVYLIRNPCDAMISLMRMKGITPDDIAGSRKVAEEFIAEQGISPLGIWAGLGSWPMNVRSWTDAVHETFPRATVLPVRYEDLRADPETELWRVVKFLDLGGPEKVADAVRNCTLERMREMETRSQSMSMRMTGMKTRDGRQTSFVGEGRVRQSLGFLGDDIAGAYEELVRGESDFGHYAERYGYTT